VNKLTEIVHYEIIFFRKWRRFAFVDSENDSQTNHTTRGDWYW